jgi:diguanylate cyclase (GGDEF)-like protein
LFDACPTTAEWNSPMITVYNCLVNEHDLRLVALAAVVCAVASLAALTLLHHARRSAGGLRRAWLGVCALSTGFGIWATHFVAMLAFSPGIPSGYNIGLTALSLLAAIAVTSVGLSASLSQRLPGAAWIGGAIVGGGIATMHYTGMAAFEVEGRITWAPGLVLLSILLGALFGSLALKAGLRDQTEKSKAFGALLLTLAICSHHFTAMGAVSISADPTAEVSASALPPHWLAVIVAAASFAIVVLALAGLALDLRDRRRTEVEADRMRGLANAAVEGLVICDGDIIVTANNSFSDLVGAGVDQIVGTEIEAHIAGEPQARGSDEPVEADLRRMDGSEVPVELITRPVDFLGRPHRALVVRDLRGRKKAERHIRFLAHHDALTGLPNRASFAQTLDVELAGARSHGRRLAVLCLDLDRFKEVNDLFGHAAGDNLLKVVATCIAGALSQRQVVARLGGDEFAIIAPDLLGPTDAGRLAERILQEVNKQAGNSSASATVSASIGIAMYPDDGADREVLLNHADTALYRAKSDGRSTYRFFEASMGSEVRERRHLEHDLRHAVARGEMRLVYQPQTNVDTGEPIGFEALIRWDHPTRGSISPGLFIPVAEETGVILSIGEWVLRTACAEAASWLKPLRVAVNVSAVQLHKAEFPQLLHEILVQTGLRAERLELEITETALIRDLNRALLTLRRLKALGVRIAMDDFGTGYSSLSNLRAFPFDKIKVDGSFIKSVNVNEQAATIVRAVLGIGRGLGLPVLAEGVEDAGELKFLKNEKCAEAQGYLLGKPADISTFRRLTHGAPIDLPTAEDAAARMIA